MFQHVASISLTVCFLSDDYIPMRGSVIGALLRELNLSVEDLAWYHKKEDLRLRFNCWISEPLEDRLPYRQLVCFERARINRDQTVQEAIEEMFRALFPAFNNENKSVITPLLGTGYQVILSLFLSRSALRRVIFSSELRS